MARSRLILFVVAALATVFCQAATSPLELREDKNQADGSIFLRAKNRDRYAPRWVWVELTQSDNISSEASFPRGWVLAPGSDKVLARLKPRDPQKSSGYSLRSLDGIGNPEREPDSGTVYLLPWAHGSKQTLTQGYFGAETHHDLRALDFDLDEGTPVHAARAGVVIDVKQDSSVGGRGASYADSGNHVHVLHTDATWAVYAHLQPNSAKVKLGQQITAGQLLGRSGHTGQAAGPHLHFAVYRATYKGSQTIPTVFKTGSGPAAPLVSGQLYYATHPGGKPFKPVLAGDLRIADLRALSKRVPASDKVSFPETRIDRRTLLWCRNGKKRPVRVSVTLRDARGVTVSDPLPYLVTVPAQREVFLFWIDVAGDQPASWQLAVHSSDAP